MYGLLKFSGALREDIKSLDLSYVETENEVVTQSAIISSKSEVQPGLPETSKMESFATIVNS